MPYFLTYGCEAMLPIEVEAPSHPKIAYAFDPNQEAKKKYLELINELRDEAAIQMVEYQRRIFKYYNPKVKERFKNEI